MQLRMRRRRRALGCSAGLEAWVHVFVILTARLCGRSWATAVRRVAAGHVQSCRDACRRPPSWTLCPLLSWRNIRSVPVSALHCSVST